MSMNLSLILGLVALLFTFAAAGFGFWAGVEKDKEARMQAERDKSEIQEKLNKAEGKNEEQAKAIKNLILLNREYSEEEIRKVKLEKFDLARLQSGQGEIDMDESRKLASQYFERKNKLVQNETDIQRNAHSKYKNFAYPLIRSIIAECNNQITQYSDHNIQIEWNNFEAWLEKDEYIRNGHYQIPIQKNSEEMQNAHFNFTQPFWGEKLPTTLGARPNQYGITKPAEFIINIGEAVTHFYLSDEYLKIKILESEHVFTEEKLLQPEKTQEMSERVQEVVTTMFAVLVNDQ